jgi:hypothetical protein
VKLETAVFSAHQLSLHNSFSCTASQPQLKQTPPKSSGEQSPVTVETQPSCNLTDTRTFFWLAFSGYLAFGEILAWCPIEAGSLGTVTGKARTFRSVFFRQAVHI